jgi:hypothetical protein
MFDSPAGADVTVRGGLDTTAAAEVVSPEPSAVRKLAGSPVSAPAVSAALAVPAAAPEYASQSSEDSGVVVNPSDANSLADLADDELPAVPASSSATARPPAAIATSSTNTTSAAGTSPASAAVGKTGFSQETAKYLAALDDQDEEEDGWN